MTTRAHTLTRVLITRNFRWPSKNRSWKATIAMLTNASSPTVKRFVRMHPIHWLTSLLIHFRNLCLVSSLLVFESLPPSQVAFYDGSRREKVIINRKLDELKRHSVKTSFTKAMVAVMDNLLVKYWVSATNLNLTSSSSSSIFLMRHAFRFVCVFLFSLCFLFPRPLSPAISRCMLPSSSAPLGTSRLRS